MRTILLIFSLFIALGCESPDEQPELKDPLYMGLIEKEKASSAAVDAELKKFAEMGENLKKVVPQTGQIKYAQKYFFDSKSRLEALREQHRYDKSMIESRRNSDRETYLAAYYAKKPWPEPEEYENWKIGQENQKKNRTWSVKARRAQLNPGSVQIDGAKESGSAEKKEKD